jgi:haloalkane dehalogenase
MAKVLLTGIIGPFDNIQFNIAGDRLTRDQDIFTSQSHNHYQALHFLAENISPECVVLEHPSPEDLEEELKKGYDFVGVNFTMVNIGTMIDMCDLIRKAAPDTEIVLGGYGTSCFTTIFKGEEEILKLADYICHGEGVSFMRKLVGDPMDAPLKQVVGPTGGSDMMWRDPYPPGCGGFVVSGLGCPNMCEFCCTSFYYGGEFVEISTADQLFEGMKQIYRRESPGTHPQMLCGEPDIRESIAIFDENLYKDKEKVARLGQLIREDEEFGLARMNYFSFGTIEDLSRYDVVEDLVMNGVGSIWIGVESLYSDLKKRQGRDVREVFDDLHARGITTTGSWIGGWDFHDKKNIEEDLEYFISCSPTQSQLFPLFPPPGTGLYERLVTEGRLPDLTLAKRYFGRTSGAEAAELFDEGDAEGENFFATWRKNFTEEEITAIVESGNGRLYEFAGPSSMRSLRVQLNGYEFCKNSSHRVLREERSELHRIRCVQSYTLIDVCEFFAPNQKVRRDIQRIRADYHRLLGEPTIEQQVMSKYAFLKGSLYKMQSILGLLPAPKVPFRRYVYDRQPREPNQKPYTVEYPYRDERYEHEKGVFENEMRLARRVIDVLEQAETDPDAERVAAEINKAFGNLEALGDMAKLVGALGEDLGFAKGWLRSEVLKKLGRETVYAGEEGITFDAVESASD